jgi:hypothetical protein
MKKTKRVLLPNNKKEDLGGRWARGRSEKRERDGRVVVWTG